VNGRGCNDDAIAIYNKTASIGFELGMLSGPGQRTENDDNWRSARRLQGLGCWLSAQLGRRAAEVKLQSLAHRYDPDFSRCQIVRDLLNEVVRDADCVACLIDLMKQENQPGAI
jgi:hypothetical protein